MPKLVEPITATVEYITAPKTGQYGDYQSVLFKPDSSEEKIWKSFEAGASELSILTKGTRVQLIPAGERNGKPSHQIVLLDAPAAPTPPQQAGLGNDQKRAIAAYIQEQAKLFRYCWDTAAQSMQGVEGLTSEDLRAIACHLHSSAQHKFDV